MTCFSRESHEIVWSVDMEGTYGGVMPYFGWSSSPVVLGDLVIVTPLGEKIGLLALDCRTGEKVWATESVGRSLSTPAVLDLLGTRQVVFLSTASRAPGQDRAAPATISSFDPENGSLLWRTETMLTRLTIPPPVQVDDERFFVTGGYRAGSTMLRIQRNADGYSFEELFHITRGAQIHLPLLHEDHLYLLVNEGWNVVRSRRKEGGLMCLSLDGKELWRTEDEPFFGRGNAVLAGDHLLIQDGDSGILRVAKATPAGYRTIVEVDLFGFAGQRDRKTWTPMAVADGYVLLRSQEELLCARLLRDDSTNPSSKGLVSSTGTH